MALTSFGVPLHTPNTNCTVICGSVAVGASGAPTVTDGRGYTIARTAAGDYTVTLNGDGGVGAILYADANVHTQSDVDLNITGKGISASARTFSFTCLTATTPTDPTSGDTLQIFLVVRNSSQT